ncbi:MAG: two pore domain potassium channel family protein [Dehalococcoidia bacterium]
MGEEKPFEPVRKIRPGDEVIRRKMKPRTRLRIGPRVPETVRFLKVMVTQTPLVPMLAVTATLWIVFSAGFYFAENGVNEHVNTFGQALWWSLAAVETMGTPYKPVTLTGQVVGAIWAVLGVVLFWGTIIASVTSYFMKRRERMEKQIILTIEHNLEQLDKLSIDELETLKVTTDVLIDEQIKRLPGRGSSTE